MIKTFVDTAVNRSCCGTWIPSPCTIYRFPHSARVMKCPKLFVSSKHILTIKTISSEHFTIILYYLCTLTYNVLERTFWLRLISRDLFYVWVRRCRAGGYWKYTGHRRVWVCCADLLPTHRGWHTRGSHCREKSILRLSILFLPSIQVTYIDWYDDNGVRLHVYANEWANVRIMCMVPV